MVCMFRYSSLYTGSYFFVTITIVQNTVLIGGIKKEIDVELGKSSEATVIAPCTGQEKVYSVANVYLVCLSLSLAGLSTSTSVEPAQ